MTRPIAGVAVLTALIGCGGLGSRPDNETASTQNGSAPAANISVQGCIVTDRDGRHLLRSVASTNPDAMTVEGVSTSINGNWLGSRDYAIATVPADVDLAALAGRVVSGAGTVRIPRGVTAVGTDQMQARHGARFPELELTAVTPLNETCVDRAAVDRAREPRPASPPADADEVAPAGKSPNQPVH